MRRIVIILVVLLGLPGIVACNRPDPPGPAAPPQRPLDPGVYALPSVESNAGTYLVRYRLADPPPLNELFEVEVWIFDAAEPLRLRTDVELVIDGRMPEHRHGMNREPTVTRRKDGGFAVSGMMFHMPGFWEMHFDIVDGPMAERAQIDVTLD